MKINLNFTINMGAQSNPYSVFFVFLVNRIENVAICVSGFFQDFEKPDLRDFLMWPKIRNPESPG